MPERSVSAPVGTGAMVRFPESEQQVAVPGTTGGDERERVQRPLIHPSRLVVSEPATRVLGGGHRVAHSPLGVPGSGGLEEVMRELSQPVLEPAGVGPLERLADSFMQPRPPARGQPIDQRIADQDVREAIAARPRQGDHARRLRLFKRLEQPFGIRVRDRLQDPQIKVAPDHSRNREHLTAIRAERSETPDDQPRTS